MYSLCDIHVFLADKDSAPLGYHLPKSFVYNPTYQVHYHTKQQNDVHYEVVP